MKSSFIAIVVAASWVPAAAWADDRAEVQAFVALDGGAHVELSDAVRAAQTHVGGIAVEAEFDADSSFHPVYKVEIVDASGLVWDVFVDPANGEILRAREDEDRERLPNGDVSLLDAITAAEAHHGGRAMAAEFDDFGFTDAFAVEVVQDLRVYDVYISAEDASVLASREDLDD